MPIELITKIASGGTVVMLMAAVWWLVRRNEKLSTDKDGSVKDMLGQMRADIESEKTRNAKREEELSQEIKALRSQREEEFKGWLGALNENTQQLKSVAEKLEAIPAIQKDFDTLKRDVEDIKRLGERGRM